MSDIQSNFRVTTQAPFSIKEYFPTFAEMIDTSNFKAFSYYEDMVVRCVEQHKNYIWREAEVGEIGVLPNQITYPENRVYKGIDYSNRTFDFFELVTTGGVTTEGITANVDVPGLGVKKGDVIPTASSITDVLKQMLVAVFTPTITAPSLVLSLSNFGTREVGETFNEELTAIFKKGSINGDMIGGFWDPTEFQNFRSGDADQYTLDGIVTTTAPLNKIQVSKVLIEGSNNRFDASVTYLEGPEGFDSEGNSAITPLVAGGSVSNFIKVPAAYKYWIHTGSNSPTSSSDVRALPTSQFMSTNQFEFDIPANSPEFSIYFPATYFLESVLYKQSANSDITGNLTETEITVNDAGGNPITYKKLTHKISQVGYAVLATYIIKLSI